MHNILPSPWNYSAREFKMFDLSIDPLSMTLASLTGLIYDYYLVNLLHQRYDRQFGLSFMLSGIVAFILPIFSLVTLPIYLLLEWSVPPPVKVIFLFFYTLVLVALGYILKRRLLRKIFMDPKKAIPTQQVKSE